MGTTKAVKAIPGMHSVPLRQEAMQPMQQGGRS